MITLENKKIIGLTGSPGVLGPVPAGKSWLIKVVVVRSTVFSSANTIHFSIDGVIVAEGAFSGIDQNDNIIGGGTSLTMIIAKAGQTVDVDQPGASTLTYDVHMSYFERDIPTP